MNSAKLGKTQKKAAQDYGRKLLTLLLTVSMVMQSFPLQRAYALEGDEEAVVEMVEKSLSEEVALYPDAIAEQAPLERDEETVVEGGRAESFRRGCVRP